MTRAGFVKVLLSGAMLLLAATAIGGVIGFFWLMRASGEIVEVSSSADETVFRTRFVDGFAVFGWLILLGVISLPGWAAWAVWGGRMGRPFRLFLAVGLSVSLAGLVAFGAWRLGEGTLTLRERVTISYQEQIDVTRTYVLWSTTETMVISDVTEVTYDWADHPEHPPMDSVTIVNQRGDELKIDGGLAPSTWLVGRRLADAAGVHLRCVLNWSHKPDETVWNCTY